MTTYKDIEAQALEELQEVLEDETAPSAERLQELIDNIAGENVPPMTTVLFGLVVDDNSLAFEDGGPESSEPFAVLAGAVRERLTSALTEWADSRDRHCATCGESEDVGPLVSLEVTSPLIGGGANWDTDLLCRECAEELHSQGRIPGLSAEELAERFADKTEDGDE